jgi:hypothetical protein
MRHEQGRLRTSEHSPPEITRVPEAYSVDEAELRRRVQDRREDGVGVPEPGRYLCDGPALDLNPEGGAENEAAYTGVSCLERRDTSG